jgi:TRAP transporter 4TM/12TM fusion protein
MADDLTKKLLEAVEKDEVKEELGRFREYKGPMAQVARYFSAFVSSYCVFYILNISGYYLDTHFYGLAYLSLFLFFMMTLVFLLVPATKKSPRNRLPWYDLLFILAGLAPTLHEFINAGAIASGMKVGATVLDQAMFFVLLVVLLEAVRRTAGTILLGIIIFFIFYAHYAYLLPGLWGAPKFGWQELTEYLYLYDSGIFGMIFKIAAELIIFFVIFGSFLVASGLGKLLVAAALRIAGKYRGGPAKVTIVGSALFGIISGSPAASVGTIGSITIPLMKKVGYRNHYAGAIEAVVAVGSVLDPPVMGAVAFMMAALTGAGYGTVCAAAIFPSVLYYMALFFQIDFEAAKMKLVGLPPEQIPPIKQDVKEGAHLIIPVVLLVYLLVVGWDAVEAVLYSTACVVIVSWFRKRTRMGFRKIVDALAAGAQGVITIAPVMAAVGGVVFGSLTLTGIIVNVATLILQLAGGNLWLLAIFTYIFMYGAGFGVGEMLTYLVMGILVAPAFVNLGVPVLAAHFFIFIAGMSMFIVPPNCPAVWVACSIAKSKVWETGFQAMKLGIVAFLVPFVLLVNPGLLLIGSPTVIVLTIILSMISIFFLAAGLEGYALTRTRWWERICFFVGGVALFIPTFTSRVYIAAPLLLLAMVAHVISWRRVCTEQQGRSYSLS